MLAALKLPTMLAPQGRSVSDLAPFATLVRDDVVLLKDGSLMRVFKLKAEELDDLEAHNRAKIDQSLQLALRKLSPQCTVWTRMRKRARVRHLDGVYTEVAAAHVAHEYELQFHSQSSFVIERHVGIVLSPAKGWSGFKERLTRRMRAGSGLLQAAAGAWRDGLSLERLLGQVQERLDDLLREFDGLTGGFESTALVELSPLANDELRGFLMGCTSLSYSGAPVREPDRWQFLDGYLCADEITAQRDCLVFRGSGGSRHVAVLALKEWPQSTPAGVLNGLLALPCDYTVSQAFVVASDAHAKRYIRGMQLFYLNTRKDLRQAIAEYITKSASEMRNVEKQEAADDSESALGALGRSGMFGFHTVHILVEASNTDELDRRVSLVNEQLESAGYVTLKESVGQVTAFAGTIPGARGHLVRAGFVTSGNVAAMWPAYGPHHGTVDDAYYSEQMGGKQSSLIQLQTPYCVPYAYCMHNASDAAHMLIVGPTRTGKTVFALLLASHYMKYGGNFIGIDKDRSMKVFSHAMNIPYTDPEDGEVFLNPLRLLEEGAQHREFLVKWVVGLLEARGERLTSSEKTEVEAAFERLAAVGKVYRLSGLATQLPAALRERLAPWLNRSGLGRYFDNDRDSFAMSGRMAIELGGWLNNVEVASHMLDYLFYRVSLIAAESYRTRRPTMIYIPEVWAALRNPQFSARIEEWLKTMAKKLCHVMMDSQSIEDIAGDDSFKSFRACVPNLVFSADARAEADREFYKRNFALTDLQVSLIARGLPKRSYVLVEGTSARLLDVQVPRSALAFLRSDVPALRALRDALSAVGSVEDDAWREMYLNLLQVNKAKESA